MERILAVDYGTRRVGLALSDPLGMTAQPLVTLEKHSPAEVCAAIKALVADHGIGTIVVGMPNRLSGRPGAAAERTREFVTQLAAGVPCTVVTWDERLSSRQAERELHQMAVKPSRNKQLVDIVAATLLLQSYLDSLGGARRVADAGEDEGGAIDDAP